MDTDTASYGNTEQKPSSASHERFQRMSDLHSRFIQIRDAHNKQIEWENLNKAYERWSYPNKDVNFGDFRGKVDKEVGLLEDLLTNRMFWMRVHTYEGKDEKERAYRSRHITDGIHEYCIKPWPKRDQNVRLDSFDCVMYGKGTEWFCSPHTAWSENVPVTSVFPDSNAGMDPTEYDLLFIKRKYTIAELYWESKAAPELWDMEAVKDLIDYAENYNETEAKRGDAFSLLERGECSPATQDLSISLVFGYVKEYKAENDKKITCYVFPENGSMIPYKDGVNVETKEKELEKRYLYKRLHMYECFSQIIAIRSNLTTRSFWNTMSFAEQNFAACKFSDKMKNKMIRGTLRGMNVYIKSMNTDQQDKLKNLTDDEVQVVDPDTQLEVTQVTTNIQQAFLVLKQIMIDNDNSQGNNLESGSQNVRGRAITAEEARIQSSRALTEKNTDIKMWMLNEGLYGMEIYRRFIDEIDEGSSDKEKKYRKMFKDKMESLGIPPSAYKLENVCVYPYHNPSAAMPNGIVDGMGVVLGALARNPQSDGEWNAIHDIIAAVVGEEAVDYYLEDRDYVDSDASYAGMENEAMMNPDVNPKNIVVLEDQNHVIHMTMHLHQAAFIIGIAAQKMEMIQTMPETEKKIVMFDLLRMAMSLNMIMSHYEAHVQMYARSEDVDKRVQANLEQFKRQAEQVRLREQALENALKKLLESSQDSTLAQAMNNHEFAHKQRMDELAYQTATKMANVKLGSSIEKAQHNLDAGDAKRQQTIEGKAQDQEIKNVQAKEDLENKRSMAAAGLAEKKTASEMKLTAQAAEQIQQAQQPEKPNDKKGKKK